MLKTCVHQNCAVCTDIGDRELFKSILKTSTPDVYICKHAVYNITNFDGGEFILRSLYGICKGTSGCYVHDMYTANLIFLNKENFKILCSKKGKCTVTPNCRIF